MTGHSKNSKKWLQIAAMAIALLGVVAVVNGRSKIHGRFAKIQVAKIPDSKPVAVAQTVFADCRVQQVTFQSPDGCPNCGSANGCDCGGFGGSGLGVAGEELPSKYLLGVDQNSARRSGTEPSWQNARQIPWEQFAYGEYIGPPRTPHVPEYRIRIGDQISFGLMITQKRSNAPYRIGVGDTLQITSVGDPSIDRTNIKVNRDGTISMPMIGTVDAAGLSVSQLAGLLELRYGPDGEKKIRDPAITVQVVDGDLSIRNLRDAFDARAGVGGQAQTVTVAPDGTIRLPLIGAVPAIGLSIDELAAEVNARYNLNVEGVFITPNLIQRAPSVIYVLGAVTQPGLQDISNGPRSVLQALAVAQNQANGGNIRQVIVFRRDQNWRLIATKLDLSGALNGRSPHPADEIWLRNGDIVLVPPTPILRLARAVDLYLSRTVYSIFPQQQQLNFNFDRFQRF